MLLFCWRFSCVRFIAKYNEEIEKVFICCTPNGRSDVQATSTVFFAFTLFLHLLKIFVCNLLAFSASFLLALGIL